MTDLPVPYLRVDDRPFNPDGRPAQWFRDAWNELVRRTGGESTNAILGVINGHTQLSDQQAADRAASVSRDAGLAGTGDGTGTSDSDIFTGQASNGATWVTLVTNQVTPTGAGNYKFTAGDGLQVMADLAGTGISSGTVFSGNWRIRESDGVTPVVKDSGTFTATYFPEVVEEHGGEGGDPFTITYLAYFEFAFVGLPGPTDTVANTYNGAPTDLTFEIQQASGANDISGLCGSMKTVWA